MRNILLMSDMKESLILWLVFGSPFIFILGIILVAASKTTRKAGIIMVIVSVIAFIIGFGTCISS